MVIPGRRRGRTTRSARWPTVPSPGGRGRGTTDSCNGWGPGQTDTHTNRHEEGGLINVSVTSNCTSSQVATRVGVEYYRRTYLCGGGGGPRLGREGGVSLVTGAGSPRGGGGGGPPLPPGTGGRGPLRPLGLGGEGETPAHRMTCTKRCLRQKSKWKSDRVHTRTY